MVGMDFAGLLLAVKVFGITGHCVMSLFVIYGTCLRAADTSRYRCLLSQVEIDGRCIFGRQDLVLLFLFMSLVLVG